ncbi:MAG TPA: nitrogen fixation protein NifX [Rhodocyclaceae bacterium]
MKVAFATEDLKTVDAHFGWARQLAVYEIGPESHALLEVVQFDGDLKEDGSEDKLEPKLNAIRDCAIVYVAAIGGSAAAKVVNLRVHPIKVTQPEAIADIIVKLQGVLRGTPPPWLRKVLLKDKPRSFDFDDEESEAHHG